MYLGSTSSVLVFLELFQHSASISIVLVFSSTFPGAGFPALFLARTIYLHQWYNFI